MKSIAQVYLAYLETAVIGLVTGFLLLISISGIAYMRSGLLPAIFAVITLSTIAYAGMNRRRILNENPDLNEQYFKEFRVFFRAFESKTIQTPQEVLIKVIPIMVVVIASLVIWSSFSISADVSKRENLLQNRTKLTDNQEIVEATPEYPAIFYSNVSRKKIFEIGLTKVSGKINPEVTAVIKPAGAPNGSMMNNETEGYETTYVAGNTRFKVQILKITDSSVYFLIDRLP